MHKAKLCIWQCWAGGDAFRQRQVMAMTDEGWLGDSHCTFSKAFANVALCFRIGFNSSSRAAPLCLRIQTVFACACKFAKLKVIAGGRAALAL